MMDEQDKKTYSNFDYDSALNVVEGVKQPEQISNFYLEKMRQKRRSEPTVDELVDGILHGDRVMLSRAITLVESSRFDHRRKSQEVFKQRTFAQVTAIDGVGFDAVDTQHVRRENNLSDARVVAEFLRRVDFSLRDEVACRRQRNGFVAQSFVRDGKQKRRIDAARKCNRDAVKFTQKSFQLLDLRRKFVRQENRLPKISARHFINKHGKNQADANATVAGRHG